MQKNVILTALIAAVLVCSGCRTAKATYCETLRSDSLSMAETSVALRTRLYTDTVEGTAARSSTRILFTDSGGTVILRPDGTVALAGVASAACHAITSSRSHTSTTLQSDSTSATMQADTRSDNSSISSSSKSSSTPLPWMLPTLFIAIILLAVMYKNLRIHLNHKP